MFLWDWQFIFHSFNKLLAGEHTQEIEPFIMHFTCRRISSFSNSEQSNLEVWTCFLGGRLRCAAAFRVFFFWAATHAAIRVEMTKAATNPAAY